MLTLNTTQIAYLMESLQIAFFHHVAVIEEFEKQQDELNTRLHIMKRGHVMDLHKQLLRSLGSN